MMSLEGKVLREVGANGCHWPDAWLCRRPTSTSGGRLHWSAAPPQAADHPASGTPLVRSARAFTIVEVVVVLLLMSVMLTMTAVALTSGMAGVAARESAIRLRNSLRYAHQYAVIHGCPCRVGLAREKGWYELTCRPDPDQELYAPMPGGRVGHLAERVRFGAIEVQGRPEAGGNDPNNTSEAAAVINFDATGQGDAARIELTDGKAFYTLTVSPYSGLVRLHKGPASEVPSDREDLDG